MDDEVHRRDGVPEVVVATVRTGPPAPAVNVPVDQLRATLVAVRRLDGDHGPDRAVAGLNPPRSGKPVPAPTAGDPASPPSTVGPRTKSAVTEPLDGRRSALTHIEVCLRPPGGPVVPPSERDAGPAGRWT